MYSSADPVGKRINPAFSSLDVWASQAKSHHISPQMMSAMLRVPEDRPRLKHALRVRSFNGRLGCVRFVWSLGLRRPLFWKITKSPPAAVWPKPLDRCFWKPRKTMAVGKVPTGHGSAVQRGQDTRTGPRCGLKRAGAVNGCGRSKVGVSLGSVPIPGYPS
jgi:hypothetical protein